MKTIWKYELKPKCRIEIPLGAKILCVDEQHGEAVMWALVDKNNVKEKRLFSCYGTGHMVPENPGLYIGTFQLMNGGLVYHVFEELEALNE